MDQTKAETCDQILALFKKYGNEEMIVTNDSPLTANIFEEGFVDSFSITSVIALIEEMFDYTFTPKQLQGDEIRTIEGMATILGRETVVNQSP